MLKYLISGKFQLDAKIYFYFKCMMKTFNFTSILISISLIFYILYLGKSFFVPLLISLVLWYLIINITLWIRSFHIKTLVMPYFLAMFFAIAGIVLFIAGFTALVNSNIGKVMDAAPEYQTQIQDLSNRIVSILGADKSLGINEIIKTIDVPFFVKSFAGIFATVAGHTVMIIVYTLFMILEYQMWDEKMKYIFKRKEGYKSFIDIINKINQDIKVYIKIKTLASFFTGLFSYIVLSIIGVDFAMFWALIIFTLNYIPTVGSIIAVFFPLMFTLIQFDSFTPFIFASIFLISIQMIIGNILEPRFMGKSLNLSPLVILVALTIWGSIWGVVGMFLCVPIMVIMNIILAKFERTKPLAIMLSESGEV